jgi:hypothetical protein
VAFFHSSTRSFSSPSVEDVWQYDYFNIKPPGKLSRQIKYFSGAQGYKDSYNSSRNWYYACGSGGMAGAGEPEQ